MTLCASACFDAIDGVPAAGVAASAAAKHEMMTAGAVRLTERRTFAIAGLDRRPGRGRFVTSSAP
jgi:hypothetical protein